MSCMRLQLSEVEKEAQKGLASAVGGSAGSLLDSCPPDLWPRLRRLLAASVSKACKVRLQHFQFCRAADAPADCDLSSKENSCIALCTAWSFRGQHSL